jgi:hypothetical protein
MIPTAMSCTDWEVPQSYRSRRDQYNEEWENAFRLKYENEMVQKRGTHFYVGAVHHRTVSQ